MSKRSKILLAIIILFLSVGVYFFFGPQPDSGLELSRSKAQATPNPLLEMGWEEVINLTSNPTHSTTNPFNGFQMGIDSLNRVHVGFRDNKLNSDVEEIYYKRHNGTAWEQEIKISNIPGLITLGSGEALDVNGPALTVSPSGEIHIVWNFAVVHSIFRNQTIKVRKFYYQRSTDGGNTFTTPILLGEGGDRFGGATICSGNQGTQKIVNVISSNINTKELYAYYSSDNGESFNVSPIATYLSAKEAPVCSIDSNGSVYVVWQDDRDGVVVDFKRRDVHFARSLDAGKTWGPVKNLTNTPGAGSSDQSLAVDTSGKVHVVYHDNSNDGNDSWEMYYLQSPDRGATWGAIQKLTSTVPGPEGGPNIDLPSVATTKDGKVHIVWQDTRNGYLQIFYTRGDGATWEPEVPINGNRSQMGGATSPSIVTNDIDNSIHILWSAYPPLNSEPDVFYRKMNSTFPIPTPTPTNSPIPTLTPTPEPPVLKEDFTSLSLTQGAANGWTHVALGNNNSELPDNSPNFAIVNSPDRSGEKALQLTIGPDDWVYDGDRSSDKERAELIRKLKEATSGTDWWYAWSVYIPTDYNFVNDTSRKGTWQIMGQFHDDAPVTGLEPPIDVIYRSSGGTDSELRFNLALTDEYPAGQGGYPNQFRAVKIKRGEWVDIKLHILWKQQPDNGYIDIWVNEVQVERLTGPNMYDANPNFFRLGIYRGFSQPQTNTFYLGRVRAASTEAGLQLPPPSGLPTPTPTSVPGDANGDGTVNILDFNMVISHFGESGTNTLGDVNHDGTVNILDFNMVISHFGE